eukprot:403355950
MSTSHQETQKSTNQAQSEQAAQNRQKPISKFGTSVTTFHNVVQMTSWFVLLFVLLFNLLTNGQDTLYRIRETLPNFIFCYQLVQIDMTFEIVYTILGWQRANVVSLFFQTLGRVIFGLVSLPKFVNVPESPAITVTLLMFCVVESFRYAFYLSKQFNKDQTFIGRFLGWFRYNGFIVCYPIGALGENIVLWNAKDIVYQEKFMAFEMPNSYNFTFRLGDFMFIAPFLYCIIFPQIYMYLLKQRTRYYRELRQPQNKNKSQ